MSEVKELYLRALAKYLQQVGDGSDKPDLLLAERFSTLPVSEIIAMHRECVKDLTDRMDPEAAVRACLSSYSFLDEVLALSRDPICAVPDSLIELKNKYENVLQHLDSGIALFNASGCVSFVNMKMARLIGVPRKALIGHHLFELLQSKNIPRRVRKSLLHMYREMVDYRTPYYELISPQGRHLLVTITYEDELGGDVLISVKDVTEFKRIEQAAYQNDKLAILGKISASIAHEIRNPLTSIRGFIQFLKPDFVALGKQEYAEIILSEIDRANQIIYEFLNASKPTAPVVSRIQVASLLKEVMLLFESDALLNQYKIEVEPVDPDMHIAVDVRQVKQVLMNIVKNAVEAVMAKPGSDGFIRITAERERSWIKISVHDNGNGMDVDTVSRLFDPFFTTKQEGTGLGLSVSYRIIKNHGGKIDVRSKPGEGTTFTIRLAEK